MSRVPTIGRRAALHGALGACAGLSFAPFTWRAHAADAIQTARVTDKLAVLSGGGGNVLALSTGDGLVVVDSGAASSRAPLVAALAALPNGARVHTLFNTHWHLEQIGSNETLGTAGAHIVAHEKTRQRLAYGYYLPKEDRYQKPVPKEAQPAETFYTTGETKIGGERIECRRCAIPSSIGSAAAGSAAASILSRSYSSSAMRARRSCQAMDR